MGVSRFLSAMTLNTAWAAGVTGAQGITRKIAQKIKILKILRKTEIAREISRTEMVAQEMIRRAMTLKTVKTADATREEPTTTEACHPVLLITGDLETGCMETGWTEI